MASCWSELCVLLFTQTESCESNMDISMLWLSKNIFFKLLFVADDKYDFISINISLIGSLMVIHGESSERQIHFNCTNSKVLHSSCCSPPEVNVKKKKKKSSEDPFPVPDRPVKWQREGKPCRIPPPKLPDRSFPGRCVKKPSHSLSLFYCPTFCASSPTSIKGVTHRLSLYCF